MIIDDVDKLSFTGRATKRAEQIDKGRSTRGYENYIKLVPIQTRRGEWSRSYHPNTPDYASNMGTRQFNSHLKEWRRLLHQWDPDFTALPCAALPLCSPQNKPINNETHTHTHTHT
eukprot:GHVR01156000.1.p1 GENE.GHVR01156000.1~~GHVR01156000.1.p1  ORF type:complete len:116 (-),score=39.23 GHVR01156000.1:69-416(-)